MSVEQLGSNLQMAMPASSYLLHSRRRDGEVNSETVSYGDEMSVVRPLDHTRAKEAHTFHAFAASKTAPPLNQRNPSLHFRSEKAEKPSNLKTLWSSVSWEDRRENRVHSEFQTKNSRTFEDTDSACSRTESFSLK